MKRLWMSGMWCNNLNLANGGTLISTTLSFLSDNKLGGEREREKHLTMDLAVAVSWLFDIKKKKREKRSKIILLAVMITDQARSLVSRLYEFYFDSIEYVLFDSSYSLSRIISLYFMICTSNSEIEEIHVTNSRYV